jgi:hypothetical protein
MNIQDEWLSDLKHKLEEFLRDFFSMRNQSKLLDLFNRKSENDNPNSFSKVKQQLMESEKRTMAFMRKFNRVQTDYHNLIGKLVVISDYSITFMIDPITLTNEKQNKTKKESLLS